MKHRCDCGKQFNRLGYIKHKIKYAVIDVLGSLA